MYLYPIDMCYHVVVPDAFLVDASNYSLQYEHVIKVHVMI